MSKWLNWLVQWERSLLIITERFVLDQCVVHSCHHSSVLVLQASLMSTIINLAQNYVGSNNVNLLLPIGQFGTRLAGGKDAASARYIFTLLSPVARKLFIADDDPSLNFLYEDNLKIEPEWYCPVIPLVLVNGCEGIGTGYSTFVPNHDPREIVANLKRMMLGEQPQPMVSLLDKLTYLCMYMLALQLMMDCTFKSQ